jgi:hypothetical protein
MSDAGNPPQSGPLVVRRKTRRITTTKELAMYDTIFELQMLKTLRPDLLSYDGENRRFAGTQRSRATRSRQRTTRGLLGMVPRFARPRVRSA